MSATTTARARLRRMRRTPAATVPVQTSKATKAAALRKATWSALRGQTPPAALAGEVRGAAAEALPNRRLRWAAYNGSAAAAGHGLLAFATGDPWAGAALLGDAMVSLVNVSVFAVTVGAAYVGWKVGAYASRILPGIASFAARPVGLIGAASWGQGTGELIQTGLAELAPWPVLLAPLLIAGGAGYGLLLLERRITRGRRPVRWLARIPLATLVVSSLLYAPGALL
ncbi:hypothetical protein OHU23_41265 (plasmid) [Streptomyces virginiae]|uniref:hypothetical protein n=1 Tax=Streptomyces virginiae TaxID=1961 RepID=UPI002F908B12